MLARPRRILRAADIQETTSVWEERRVPVELEDGDACPRDDLDGIPPPSGIWKIAPPWLKRITPPGLHVPPLYGAADTVAMT